MASQGSQAALAGLGHRLGEEVFLWTEEAAMGQGHHQTKSSQHWHCSLLPPLASGSVIGTNCPEIGYSS